MSIEQIFSQYNKEISTTAFELRKFLLTHLKDVTEQLNLSANIVGYGYGAGYKNLICTIIPSKKGVKLGFYKGSELPDPENILTGSGKVHKYVDIRSGEDISSAALLTLLNEAVKTHRKRIA